MDATFFGVLMTASGVGRLFPAVLVFGAIPPGNFVFSKPDLRRQKVFVFGWMPHGCLIRKVFGNTSAFGASSSLSIFSALYFASHGVLPLVAIDMALPEN